MPRSALSARAADARAGDGPRVTVAFNELDELCYHLDAERFPWTVEIEVRAPGPLDEARVRAAVAHAIATHPMARASMRPYRPTDRSYEWEIAAHVATDPVRVVHLPTETGVARLRGDVLSAQIGLDDAPPLRVWLVRRGSADGGSSEASSRAPGGRGGDALLLSASHVATDGMGALRFLRSVVRAYAGAPDPVPPVDPLFDRGLKGLAAPATVADHVRRSIGLGAALGTLGGRLSRIAVDRSGSADGGFVVHHVRIGADELAALDSRRHVDGTVNDLLLAALHLAIADWNADHGAATDRVSVMMPVNLRPRARWTELVGNYSSMVSVSTRPRDRDEAASLLGAVHEQTARAKSTHTPALFVDLLSRSRMLPAVAKQLLPLASPLAGDLLVDTAVLSNLGRVDEAFDFGHGDGGGTATELWFSPPARMPLGVGVGAVTHDGDLFVSLRCCNEQFDAAAAARFAERLRDALTFLG